MIQRVTFLMPDGTASEKLMEGTNDRADRAGLSVHELAEILAADRKAESYTVEPWKPSAVAA